MIIKIINYKFENNKIYIRKYYILKNSCIFQKHLFIIFILFNIIILKKYIIFNNIEINKNYKYFHKKYNLHFPNVLINKIRVGIYTYSLKNGGTQRISSLLINYLYKVNIFKLYIFSQKQKENNEYIIPNDIKRVVIEFPRYQNLLKKNKIHILIFQFPNEYGINLLNSIKEIKILFYQHYSFFYWLYFNYTKFIDIYKSYQQSKYILSVIPFENDYIFPKWGINSILMNNFVTFEYKKTIPSNLNNQTIIMIGRSNDKFKRLELGIYSMEYIKNELPEILMIIISNITNNYYIKNLVNDLNLEKKIKFIGYSSTPEIYYQNCSLHIFPSISESFGLVLSEAKIYGIPSILIGLDYISISKGGTFIIYDDKPEYISIKAMEIFKNKKYKKRFGKEARLSMVKYNNENLLNKWIELLMAIFNGDEYYNSLIKRDKKMEKKQALNILINQVNLLKKRDIKFNNITINELENCIKNQND